MAFQKIEVRLKEEVGSLIELVRLGRAHGYFKDTAPFWSLARILFPIVESLGRLLLRSGSSANLKYGLEQLGKEYKGKSVLISLMYRHSLIIKTN